MDTTPNEKEATGLSVAGWVWLGFWFVLLTTTVIVALFYPDALHFHSHVGRARGIRLLLQLDWQERGTSVLFSAWFIGGMCWIWWLRARHRSQGLQKVCQQLGLTLLPTPSDEELRGLPAFPLFGAGANHVFSNLAKGIFAGDKIVVLDYSFDIALDIFGTKQQYDQTIVIFLDGATEAPDFQLLHHERRYYNKSKRKRDAGDLKVGVESHNRFAKYYKVDSESKSEVHDFFDIRLMDFFVASDRFDVEVVNGVVLVYEERKRVKPRVLPEFLVEAANVVRALQKS